MQRLTGTERAQVFLDLRNSLYYADPNRSLEESVALLMTEAIQLSPGKTLEELDNVCWRARIDQDTDLGYDVWRQYLHATRERYPEEHERAVTKLARAYQGMLSKQLELVFSLVESIVMNPIIMPGNLEENFENQRKLHAYLFLRRAKEKVRKRYGV